jgi:transposase
VVRVEVVHRRCGGIDISKKDAKVCVRVEGSGRRATTASVTTWGAMSNEILALREHLIAEKVTCVVMESTGDYWKPFYYLLEGAVNVMLVNPRDARNRPGHKTDLLTELLAGSCGGCVLCRAGLARFAACDRRWGCASGFVGAGGAAAGLSGGDGRSVSTVSAR